MGYPALVPNRQGSSIMARFVPLENLEEVSHQGR